ncbi:MAG: tripartite tricarboxylate transporter TctB family protein [Geminicoccaceae bacterium]
MSGRSSAADTDNPNARADFWTGLVLIVLGSTAFIASLDMPRFEEREINPYTIPGLVPGAIALVIAILGLLLTLRAARQRAAADPSEKTAATVRSRRLWLTLLLTLTYAAVLVSWLPFWLATALFVFAFVALFEWEANSTSTQKARTLGFALAYAGLVSALVTWVFQEIFLVRLP